MEYKYGKIYILS